MFFRYMLLVAVVFTVSACSWFRDDEPEVSTAAVDLMQAQEPMTVAMPDIEDVIYTNTNGSVQIFPLDGAPVQSAVAPVSAPVSLDREPITMTRFDAEEEAQSVLANAGPAQAVILFDHGSYRLDAGDQDILRNLVSSAGDGPIEIVGHASVDSTISNPDQRKLSNLNLSVDRAVSVAKALVASGVSPDRIKVAGIGEAQAVASQENAQAARRVEIFY